MHLQRESPSKIYKEIPDMWILYVPPFCITSFMAGLLGIHKIMTIVIVCRPQHAGEPHGDQPAIKAAQIGSFNFQDIT